MNKFRSSVLSGRGLNGDNPLVSEKQARGASTDDLVSVEIPRSEGRGTADHREADRHRLTAEQVTVTHDGQARTADLINLSGGGAMVRVDFMPRLWDRVDLHLGEGTPLECAVRWIRGDRIGLEFAHETRIEGDAGLRDSILLDVIRRTFPDIAALPTADHSHPETDQSPRDADITPRADRRHPLIWSGQLFYNHDSYAIRVRNISETGALVECAKPLPQGVEVMLDLGNGVVQFGTVTWVRADQCGLSFNGPFDLNRLAEAKPEVTPERWTRPGFLDVAPNQDSPWAEEWDRPTIEQLRDDLGGYLGR